MAQTGGSGNMISHKDWETDLLAYNFEYLRRHTGFKATDTWFVSVNISGSRTLLNYSANEDYGRRYGGNFISPTTTFGSPGMEHFMNFKNYHPETEWGNILEMREFLNQNFQQGGLRFHIYTWQWWREYIKEFVRNTFQKVNSSSVLLPPVNDNGDLKTIGFAVELLNWFKPKLMVVDMTNIDVCHGDYTSYLKNLHRADHGVGFLWREIQRIPEMAGKTTMIVMPEHGRDLEHNPIQDDNDWYAYDHSGNNENTRRIFSLMAGPGIDGGLRVGNPEMPVGDASDIVPTIADYLNKRYCSQQRIVGSYSTFTFWQNIDEALQLIGS